jgi:hypothetical protein
MRDGAVFIDFLKEAQQTIDRAKQSERLAPRARDVQNALNRIAEIAVHLGKTAASPSFKVAFAYAHPFLEAMGDVSLAWMHLWRASAALPRLEKAAKSSDLNVIRETVSKNKDTAFYDGQLKTAEYFIRAVLPITMGKLNAIIGTCPAAVEMHENSFGG